MKVITMNNVSVKLWVDQLDAHAWEEVNNLPHCLSFSITLH